MAVGGEIFQDAGAGRQGVRTGPDRVEWVVAKAARDVRVGDRLVVRNEGGEFQVEVLQLSEVRGPAAVAQTLYRESEESQALRAKLAEERRAGMQFTGIEGGRPFEAGPPRDQSISRTVEKSRGQAFPVKPSRSGDSLCQVGLLALRLGADGEGVEHAAVERVADRLGLAVAQVALAKDLHPDDAFPGRAHLLDDADDRVGSASMWEPMGLRRTRSTSTQGEAAAARSASMVWQETAMGADDALLLGLREHVHDAAVACGPVGLGDAVDQEDVDVVDAEFLAEAVEIGAHGGGVAVVGSWSGR